MSAVLNALLLLRICIEIHWQECFKAVVLNFSHEGHPLHDLIGKTAPSDYWMMVG